MKDYTWLIILIAAAVGAVVFLIAKKIKKNKGSEITEFVEATREAFKEEMAESAPAKMSEPLNHNPSQSKSAKIFINGGRPAGALMGKLYVDGKLISLLYSEAPIEVSLSKREHHIVVEGGVYGDARIDRTVDFGELEVLVVDMPGADDDDVIRHQRISLSEYNRALRENGFSVTRKYV